MHQVTAAVVVVVVVVVVIAVVDVVGVYGRWLVLPRSHAPCDC